MKVLIVEDELIIALMLEQMVTKLGHQVIGKESTGQAAVEKARAERPDFILMDIRLKGNMDGIEAIQEIQNDVSLSVIYITGNTDQKYNERVKQTEFVDFLIKPISQHQLSESFDIAS